MPSLVVGIARIDLQRFVGHIAKHGLRLFLVILCLDVSRREERTLVAVGHHDDRHIIIFATLVKAVLVVADDIAVDTRPETSEAHIAVTEFHRVHLAHLLDILFFQMFHEGEALLFGTLLRSIQAQRTWFVAPRGERASALTDGSTEKTLCQGRGTEHATADGTSALTEDSDLRGVATKVSNVTLHPLEGEDLVEQTVVAGMAVFALFAQFRMC